MGSPWYGQRSRRVWAALAAVWAGLTCLAVGSCQTRQEVQPPLAIEVEANENFVTIRSDRLEAGQVVTVTLIPPGTGSPELDRAPDFFGLAGVQLAWLPDGQRSKEAQFAAASGARTIGLDFEWRRIEPEQDIFDWQVTDDVVVVAKRHGLRLVPMLPYTPRWASSAPEALLDSHLYPPTNYDDYRDFVYHVVERYRPYGVSPLTRDGYGISDWVIWNEPAAYPAGPAAPQHNEFWAGGMEAYVLLLRAGYEGAHAADPNCNVLNGGLADATWLGEEFALPGMVERLYDPDGDGNSADGGRPYFDTLNIHTYPPGRPDSTWYTECLTAVRAVMERFDDAGKAIWLTETGYGTAANPPGSSYLSEADQARGVAVTYQACAEFPYVERVLWWSLRDYYRDDSAANPAMEAHFGLLRASFAPKLSFFAYSRLTGAAGEPRSWVVQTDADGTARLEVPADFPRDGRTLVFAVRGDGATALAEMER